MYFQPRLFADGRSVLSVLRPTQLLGGAIELVLRQVSVSVIQSTSKGTRKSG